MIKVLHTAPLRSGGITSFVLNVNEIINHEEFLIYNICFRDEKEFSEERFISQGGIKRVIDVENIRFKPYKMYAKYKALYKLIKVENIDVFHFDTDTADQVFLAMAAKKAGAKVIYHSHNSESWRKGFIWKWFNEFCKLKMKDCVDYYLACSDKAAKYLFPKSIVVSGDYEVVTNGIDLSKYVYNETIRNEYRDKYNLTDRYVVGHVGRFNKQKNHSFILDIFEDLLKSVPNAVLLLIGEGELENEIKEKAKNKGIDDNIIFWGRTSEVYNIMQIMDVFLFPSLYEGLPVAGVEAQASGLPLVLSDSITAELQMTEPCYYLSLDMPINVWTDTLLSVKGTYTRKNTYSDIVKAGYDIFDTVHRLEDIYKSLLS